MELTFLPEETIAKKTYKHFTVNNGNNTVAESLPAVKRLEFFYIGKKAANIDALIQAFESGYAAECADNAQSMLKRLVSNVNSITIPDIVIAEASLGFQQLRSLHLFFSTQPLLATVPFVVEASGLPVADIAQFRNSHFVDEIIFLQDYTRQTLIRKVDFLKKVKAKFIQEANQRAVETYRRQTPGIHAILKRGFDIIISGALLLAISPLLLLIALAIRLESKGSIFYVAKRAGRGYKIFNFYKFRTMYTGADKKIAELQHLNQYNATEQGAMFFKISNDPRITKVGNFLRKTSLDELPQFLNVLKGDMSLVGNRPLPLYEAASLTTDEWAKRFMAPAGITGLWQIKKRGREEMSIEERITLDIDYADKYNFLYDLWIMANTPSALIQKTNA